MRRRKSRSPKGTRAAKSPKRQPWTPRSPSPAPRQRERTGESLRKKLVRWGGELESLVTVFPSRREVHEVVKHVSYVMMAMAATILLPKFAYSCFSGLVLLSGRIPITCGVGQYDSAVCLRVEQVVGISSIHLILLDRSGHLESTCSRFLVGGGVCSEFRHHRRPA